MMLRLVWQNLLSNAIKYTHDCPEAVITIGSIDRAQETVFFMQDNGAGFDMRYHDRLEDGATTRKFGGLGLGLAIARQIVEMHGGTIVAESPGDEQGAMFTVQIPLASLSSPPPTTKSSSASTDDLNGILILVVDDEPDSQDFEAFVLEQAGAIVTSIASGIEALQAIRQSVPDLIVSDIGMPDMDGYLLLQQVRLLEQAKHVPAIALTAYAGKFDRQKALQAGFQQHLSKPIEPDELIQVISKWVRGSSND